MVQSSNVVNKYPARLRFIQSGNLALHLLASAKVARSSLLNLSLFLFLSLNNSNNNNTNNINGKVEVSNGCSTIVSTRWVGVFQVRDLLFSRLRSLSVTHITPAAASIVKSACKQICEDLHAGTTPQMANRMFWRY